MKQQEPERDPSESTGGRWGGGRIARPHEAAVAAEQQEGRAMNEVGDETCI